MFITLPQEIQEAIVLECAIIRPSLVSTLARVCKSLRDIIYHPSDSHLWRTIFLALFDDPRKVRAIDSGEEESECYVDWRYETQRRFRAQICMDRAALRELLDFDKVVDEDVGDTMLETAFSASPNTVEDTFKNGPWLAECFRAAIMPRTSTQVHAKLNIVAAFLPVVAPISLPPVPLSSTKSRLGSRAYTYDLRNYTESNNWGPWVPGSHGAVNWIHVWHLMDVLRHNAHERGCTDLPGKGIGSLRAYSMPKVPAEDMPEKELNDWAGVQGVWLRAVSFMDYRDLHAYNFSGTNAEGSYSTSIFRDPQFAEAFRLIKAYFTVVKVDEKGPPAYPHRPTIHFVGDAGGPHQDINSHHYITKGTVSMTKHGHIRWSFSTRVGGHQWASEGVQLGNVQSLAGVIGVWSSAVHEESDPAGPFWLWKSAEAKNATQMPHMYHYHFAQT